MVNITNLNQDKASETPYISINGSTFKNLGFTDVLYRVGIPLAVKEKGWLIEDLVWSKLFFNKGLVLNMESW
jgi:hypothetical protein